MEVKYELRYSRAVGNETEEVLVWGSNRGDSGVDIKCPREIVVHARSQEKIKLGVRCAVIKRSSLKLPNSEFCTSEPVSFLMLPRSSISKTPLRLANSVGLIDAGYRGELMAVVDNISDHDYIVREGSRLFQIVNPELKPFDRVGEENLSETDRGDGGFGSTGK